MASPHLQPARFVGKKDETRDGAARSAKFMVEIVALVL
jgi:hypothetical protein